MIKYKPNIIARVVSMIQYKPDIITRVVSMIEYNLKTSGSYRASGPQKH